MNKHNSFASDVLTLTTVPFISQIAGILLMPIVTRLYAPEAFGLANALGSVVMIIAVFSTMGYHGSLILPRNHKTALNILHICFLSTIVISIISFFIVITLQEYIIEKLNAPELVNFLWLTPIFVLSHGVYQTLRYWNTRMIRFDNIAISRIVEIFVKKCYQIPAGILGYATTSSLVIADLLSITLKNIILFRIVGLRNYSISKKYFFLKLLAVAKRYRKFPLFNVWAELFSRIPAFVSAIMIIKFFGQDILGYYGLSLMVLALPSVLISGSISEAFMPRVAKAKHEGKHTELLEKIYLRMIVLIIFPFMIIGLFGNELFSIVFGSQWSESGVIARILIYYIFFEVIFSPSLSLVDIIEKQEINVIRSIINIVITFSAFMIGAQQNNFYLSLWILTFLQSASIVIFGGYIMYLIDFPFLLTLYKLIKYLVIWIMFGIALTYVNVLINHNIFYFLLMLTSATIVYYSILLYLDRGISQIIYSIFTKIIRGKS